MKSDTPIILVTVAIYVLGSYFGIAISRGEFDSLLAMDWTPAISSAIAAAFGAIAGAAAAFKLEQKRRKRDEVRLLVQNGNRVLLDLFEMWNNLVQYNKEVIEVAENDLPEQQHWFGMKVVLVPNTSSELLNPSRYEFLIGTKDGAQISADIRIESQRYSLFLWHVQERSQIMRDVVRPRWAKKGFGQGQLATLDEIQDATGIDVYHELVDITNNIKNFVAQDIDSCRALFERLRSFLESQFTDEIFIKFDDGEQETKPE